jgi:hypothetical protein
MQVRKPGSDSSWLDIEYEVGTDPVVEVYKKDVDRTLLRENLKLTHEQRLLKLQDLQRFAAELQRAGKKARGE